MKKYLSMFLVITMFFCLTGCGKEAEDNSKTNNNETNETETNKDNNNNNNNNQEEQKTNELTSIADFEVEVKKLGFAYEKTEMVASYINAESGIKLVSGDYKLEIYKFDSSSNAYKTAEQKQKVTMEGFGDFDAIVKNGYALMIDDGFPQYDKVIEIFNRLK